MMAELNQTLIPAPRVSLLDSRTGLVSREWYRYFQELFVRLQIGVNEVTMFFAGIKLVSADYTPNNNNKHLVVTGTVDITLQSPTTRSSELIITNKGTGIITLIGTVNGVTDKQIGYQGTSIRLRPVTDGWWAV